MKKSELFSLNTFDFIKGLLIAVITAVLTTVLQMLTQVPPYVNWNQVGIISIISAISYLLKQLATDSNGSIPILKIGGRKRRKKKKPTFPFNGGFTFNLFDFAQNSIVYVYSDKMSENLAIVSSIIENQNGQNVVFFEPIYYNDFETLFFEIEYND